VIGAGVVGAGIARELAARGARVTVVDSAPGVGGGCSYANAAVLAPEHVGPLATPALLREAPVQMLRRPPAVRVHPSRTLVPWLGRLTASAAPHRVTRVQAGLRELAAQSTRLHCELAEQGLNPTLSKRGAVDVYLRAPRHPAAGFLTAGELRELEPRLGHSVAGGFHHTEEWVTESRSYVRAMLRDAREHGADVRYSTHVQRLVHAGRRIVGVTTNRGSIRPDHVVLASGLHAGDLAGQVGLLLPLRGGRGYVIDVAAPHEPVSMPIRLKEHRVVITPLEDRVRVCGSIEFGEEGRPADLRRADALLEVAVKAVPALRGRPVLDRWAGDRPCSADGVPAIGSSSAQRNLSVAVGHGMWGLVLAPVTAQLVAAQVLGGPPEQGPEPYGWLHPDRFTPRLARATA
jgi:D-amino-acid dehydrogenase